MRDDRHDRGVVVDLLAPQIETLREAALRYAGAVTVSVDSSDAGFDLEAAAIRYVRRLDDEQQKIGRVDYLAIVEAAEREREASNN